LSELRCLAVDLSEGLPLGATAVHDLLHLAGMRGTAVGMSLLLAALAAEASSFELLGFAYPGVRPWTDLLAHAGPLLERLESLRERALPSPHPILLARAFEVPEDGLLGNSQLGAFVTILGFASGPHIAGRLVRAAAYLAGVIRQATHTRIPDWEDSRMPEDWLLSVAIAFVPLAERGVGASAALDVADPLRALERACAEAVSGGDASGSAALDRIPKALALLAKIFRSQGAVDLGLQVQQHFDGLAAAGTSATEQDGVDAETESPDEDDNENDGELEGEREDEPIDAGPVKSGQAAAEEESAPHSAGHRPRSPWKRGDRPSSRLSERMILQEHRRAFGPAEQSQLTALIEKSLTQPARIYAAGRPPDESAYPALIAAVGRCLGRTVAAAARTHLVNYERALDLGPALLPWERCVFVSHMDLDDGKSLQVVYANYEGLDAGLGSPAGTKLPLPLAISDRLRQLAPDVLDAEIQELMPFMPGGWGEYAGLWLAKSFNMSIGDFNLANRHALARALHASTCNRALIDLASCDRYDAAGNLMRSVALSSYLHPGTRRDKAEYLHAATGLITTSPQQVPPPQSEPEFHAIYVDVLRILGRKLRQKAEAQGSARERHEAVAVYTLVALILTTGHRVSDHIFHFPWDLDLEEGVAFICDKLKVGSEARFVPLVRVLVQMVHTYRQHLVLLIGEINTSRPTLARAVASAAGLPAPGKHGKKNADDGHPVGQFFLLEGDKIATISAADVDRLCLQILADSREASLMLKVAPGSGSLIQRMRRSLATYLWTGGLSGAMLEAFLGHNRQLHAFGAASTWSVLRDLVRVRPLIEQYIQAAEWRPLELGADVDLIVVPPIKLPKRITGADAYEGRQREASLARARARRAVRQAVLALGSHPDDRITLDSAAIAALRDEAAATLGADPPARDKLLEAFASLSAEIKWEHGITISAVTVATQHTEPGPVEVGFARDLALAGAIRSGWSAAVLDLLGQNAKKDLAPEEVWLAVIAASLVANDALLDPQQLWPILESIHARQVQVAYGRVQVRATVMSPRSEFERVVYLTRVSTAAVVGMMRSHPKAPPPQRELDRQRIEVQIASLIDAALGTRSVFDCGLSTLAAVFRPWWFLRLPGVAYAVAVGERDSPSCDFITEATLLGATQLLDTKQLAGLRAARRAPVDQEVKCAGELIKELLEKAEGDQLKGTQSSRRQRQELRRIFQDGIAAELAALMLAVPMAALRVDFIQHLLVNGGLEKEVLAFGTILAYDQRLSDLYVRCWQRDLREFSSEEFDATYTDVLSAAEAQASPNGPAGVQRDLMPLRTTLRNFHAFLRQAERVPNAPVLGLRFLQFRRRQPRSAILAPRLFDAALAATRQIAGDDSARAENASKLLAISHSYGTRRKEALYSLAGDYRLRVGALSMMVKSNAANKLKNPAHGTRLVPFSLAGEVVDRFLRAAVDAANPNRVATEPVFADPTAVERYLDFGPIARTAIAALKLSAGNARMNLHGERHGFGTRIGMAMTPPAGNVPPIRRIRAELAVDAAVAEMLSELTPRPDDWPFQIDRASMWHGNAGVGNFLDVYFHGGSWLLAEHADANAIDSTMNPAHWAALMGMTRTNIVKLRGGWKQSEGEGANLSEERVVGHFLGKLKLPDAAQLVRPATEVPATVESVARLRLSLPIADRMLVRRCEERWGLDELAYIAESEFRLRRDELEHFIDAYKGLIADTGFIDFEPSGGELVADGKANRAGVARSAPRRQALLARLDDMQKKGPTREFLRRMRDNWRQWVAPGRPLLVSRQPDDLKRTLEVLAGLGCSEWRVLVTPSWASKYGDATFQGRVPQRDQAVRFSRGPAGIAVAEAGVEVVGRLEDALVSNADLHRAMAVFCARESSE
jgi:site-specific recombinase XerD